MWYPPLVSHIDDPFQACDYLDLVQAMMDGSKAAGGEAGGRGRSFAKVVKITRTTGIDDGYIELAIYDGYNRDL